MRFDDLSGLLRRLAAMPEDKAFGKVTVFVQPESSYIVSLEKKTVAKNLPPEILGAIQKVCDHFKTKVLTVNCDPEYKVKEIFSLHYEV